MNSTLPRTALQLRSLIRPDGELELSLVDEPVPVPQANEVLVRLEASPINPSDLGLLLGAADLASLKAAGTADRPIVTGRVPEAAMRLMAGRLGQSMPVGNEGAGTVVAAGSSAEAQALVGKKVAILGGAMYAQYRCLPAAECLELPADATAADGASCFVNPMTALTMVATLRHEGHQAMVHTAAASNLGQMLHRLCASEKVPLVNIVRKPEQVQLLQAMGARYVCDSSSPQFQAQLTDALAETGATLAFDAVGGGKLAGQILACMEAALLRKASSYSRYGSPTHKQVYLYGSLDTGPTQFNRSFGMAWGMGGWLVFAYMQKLEPGTMQLFRRRIAAELKTTFASHYTRQVSLAQMLALEHIAVYGRRATGEKYLVTPSQG